MAKKSLAVLAMVGALALSGVPVVASAHGHRDQAAVVGAVVGAVAGLMIGQAQAGPNGALPGVLIGAAAGAAIGSATTAGYSHPRYGHAPPRDRYRARYVPRPAYHRPVRYTANRWPAAYAPRHGRVHRGYGRR